MAGFRKYHGLGNDYLIPTSGECAPEVIDPEYVRLICKPHYGLTSDGILYGPYEPHSAFYQHLGMHDALCAFRVLNPDGSEAEKSGNGVRIFARYLYDCGKVALHEDFVLATIGGAIKCRVDDPNTAIYAAMGTLSFDSVAIPVVGPKRDVVREKVTVDGAELEFCAVTIGNPHCVVIDPPGGVCKDTAMHFGERLEVHPLFPHRTNVQFITRLDKHNIRAEIFERGAGYTLASGTSSCACAATAIRIGWCTSPVTVHTPGGELTIEIDANYNASQCGPVARVYDATIELKDCSSSTCDK